MNINKTSWHYKWLRWWSFPEGPHVLTAWNRNRGPGSGGPCFYSERYLTDHWEPQSLCGYVNLLWGRPLFVIVTMSMAVVPVVAALILWHVVINPGLMVGGMIYGWCRLNFSFIGSENVQKEPGVVAEYIKARHQKVCPTLQYVEGER